jgi:hypothetical protein
LGGISVRHQIWVRKTLDLSVRKWRKQSSQRRLTLCICFYDYCSATINEWDVSDVTDFSEIFQDLPGFNEPIGSWDVSKGTLFVSNDQSVGLKEPSLVLL